MHIRYTHTFRGSDEVTSTIGHLGCNGASSAPTPQNFFWRGTHMKTLKGKTTAVLLGLTILFGGANVYASTALNTNILDLIRTGIATIGTLFAGEAQKNVETTGQGQKQNISTYVDKKTDDVIKELDNTKSNEVSRGQAELQNYYNELTKATDEAAAMETAKAKDKIKKDVDAQVAKAKEEMMKELEKRIKENVNKKR